MKNRTLHFQEMRIKAHRIIFVDGKRKIETKTFTQTLNPYNRNSDGSIKSGKDIARELNNIAAKWEEGSEEVR